MLSSLQAGGQECPPHTFHPILAGHRWRAVTLLSELEVASNGCLPRGSITLARWKQSDNVAHVLPSCLAQGRVGGHQIADHVPCGNVQRAFRRRPHRQRNRALGAEAYPLCSRLLAWSYSHRLGEHINGHRFVSGHYLTVTAETIRGVQGSLPGEYDSRNTGPRSRSDASM